jgi:class 3 adenylate cyclase
MQYFDSRDLNVAHLGGIALFLFSEEDFVDISIKYLKPVIRANLARAGCRIEFYEKDSRDEKALETGDLRLSGKLALDRDYRIVVSRKSRYDPNINRFARSIGFFLRIAWFAAGLLLWGHFFLMQRQISANINSQLIVFTIWILFPAFYLGYSATERYVLEKQTSTLSGLKKNLSDQVRAFDNSLELYKTWVCDVIERSVDKHFQSAEIDLSDKAGGQKMMLEVKRDLLQNGVFSKNIFLVDGSGNIHSDLFGANKKEKRFFEEFFKAFYLPVISSSAKNGQEKSKSGSQLLAGAQAEELVGIARSVLLPEEVSAMAMKTVSLDRLSGMEQQAFIFHKYLGKDKKAFLAIQAGIYMQSIERSCMLDWIEFFDQDKLSGMIWFITRKKAPSWLLRPPFWAANSSGVDGQLVFVADFLAPGLLFLNHQLTQSNVSMTTTIEIGSQEFLLASFAGQKMNEYQISALIPLQPHKKMLASFRMKLLWAMAIIFLISAIIGVRLARSFIEPVGIFAENALQVMTGNFKVRMPEKWEEQEFVSLATNFNQVVANLDSGKTLSKFVSDGALEVIRDSGRLEKDCFAIDQVIMFVRLDQFWEKTENLSPEQAVYILNLFFAMVCREIKNAGGDVSKFIGEKVLAVFNADKSNSYELAAVCALRIKREVELNPDKYQNCRVRIGLSLGKVLSGVIGGEDSLLEQTVIGDSVNLASRLCTIFSEHSILINRLMAQFLAEGSSKVELELLPEQEIKGKKTPVKIYSLTGYTAG